jgi:hypothetical protein
VAIVDFRPDSLEGPPKEFRFTPEQSKAEMSRAGHALAAQHDFLARQHFRIFAVAGASSRQKLRRQSVGHTCHSVAHHCQPSDTDRCLSVRVLISAVKRNHRRENAH